jgi:hypothetical protein
VATTIGFAGSGLPFCACISPNPNWCNHIESFLKEGLDAEGIEAGDAVKVPVFPKRNIWTNVSISKELVGSSAMMELNHSPIFGNDVVAPLGFWTKGEGRYSIQSVVLDFLRSKIDPRDDNLTHAILYTTCTSGMHGFNQTMAIRNFESSLSKWVCLWNMVMEGACTFCMEFSGLPDDSLSQLSTVPQTPAWKKK